MRFEKNRLVLCLCSEVYLRGGFSSSGKVHLLYQKVTGSKEPYGGYLSIIYKRLDKMGVIRYRTNGRYGEVIMTPLGSKVVEVLKNTA